MTCCFICFHLFFQVFILQFLIFAQTSAFLFSSHAHNTWLSYHMQCNLLVSCSSVNGWMKQQLCLLKLRALSLCGLWHHQHSAEALE